MTVLIVDDQPLILKATRKLVDWESLGVDTVLTASGAEEAKEYFAKMPVDIMLADIEMPGENGIELQKWQKDHYPDTDCIFLTSHAEFDYAREAVRGGVFDYILQPAGVEDITRVIRRCMENRAQRKEILTRSAGYERKVQQSIEDGAAAMFYQGESFRNLRAWRRDTRTEGENWQYIPGIIWADALRPESLYAAVREELQALQTPFFVCAPLGNSGTGVIIMESGRTAPKRTLREDGILFLEKMKEVLRVPVFIFAGHYVREELPREAGKVYAFAGERIGVDSGSGAFFQVDAVQSDSWQDLPDPEKWASWLANGDGALVENQIRNVIRFARREGTLTERFLETMKERFRSACVLACYHKNWDVSALDLDAEQETYTGNADGALVDYVHRTLHHIKEMLSGDTPGAEEYSVQDRIRDVISYLEKHMDENMTRRDAAKFALLSEDYFTKMFRKETGSGYKEYVLNMKIGYAKDLLSKTDMPVSLIAAKVGYDSFTNFSQLFRKYTGMTPSQWRKSGQADPKKTENQ